MTEPRKPGCFEVATCYNADSCAHCYWSIECVQNCIKTLHEQLEEAVRKEEEYCAEMVGRPKTR